jgi:hypothetical protein
VREAFAQIGDCLVGDAQREWLESFAHPYLRCIAGQNTSPKILRMALLAGTMVVLEGV